MQTSWSGSSARTVSRSSVAWWPDSGATISTFGSAGRLPMPFGHTRLKCSRRQNGLVSSVSSTIGTSLPSTVVVRSPNSGFS